MGKRERKAKEEEEKEKAVAEESDSNDESSSESDSSSDSGSSSSDSDGDSDAGDAGESKRRRVDSHSDCTVHVGNMPMTMDEATLLKTFATCGKIEAVRLNFDENGKFRRFGHVDFATSEAADKALAMSGLSVLGKKLRVECKGGAGKAQAQATAKKAKTETASASATATEGEGEGEEGNCTVFVGNLPFTVDQATLLKTFAPCGEVVAVRFEYDEHGEFRRFGHVDFATSEAADKALAMSGISVLGKKLRVESKSGGKKKRRLGPGAGAGAEAGAGGEGSNDNDAEDEVGPDGFRRPKAPVANPEAISRCFVGNLPFRIDEDSMFGSFSEEKIEASSVNWVMDRETGNFYGTAFVNFASPEDAAWAVAYSNAGFCLMDRPVRIEFCPHRNDKKNKDKQLRSSKPPSDRPEGGTVAAFFGNLPFQVTEEQLIEFCKGHGTIKAIRWIEDKETGDFKGCGFADFDSVDAVDSLVKAKNAQPLGGRSIRVDYAPSKK